ncbi:hypothetical protein C8R44DRAFT_895129 [Mycena epipterygia]|nr:hypothetical protein C8R44DRAFT_895129 [Mycena epipterygia]
MSVISELRIMLVEVGDLQTYATLFQDAFDHYRSSFPSGLDLSPSSKLEVANGGFNLAVLTLADVYNSLGAPERAVTVIRQGCRWLLGRAEQEYWDAPGDDRDAAKDGDIEEGKMHAGIVVSQEIEDYAPLFGELAECYFERELYAEALPVYERLASDDSTSTIHILRQTVVSYRGVFLNYRYHSSEMSTDKDAKLKLAEIYEIIAEPYKALNLVLEVIDSSLRARGARSKEGQPILNSADNHVPPVASLPAAPNGKQKVKRAQTLNLKRNVDLRKTTEDERAAQVQQSYNELQQCLSQLLQGNREQRSEWLAEAAKLSDCSARVGNFFRPRMYVAALSHFSFLFIQYCLILTDDGKYDEADEVLRQILMANVYLAPHFQNSIRIALIARTSAAGHHPVVVEQGRKILAGQFNNDPIRMILAVLGSGGRRRTH